MKKNSSLAKKLLESVKINEMTAYTVGERPWFYVFYNVKVGGQPKRVDLLNKETWKKYPITFCITGFDFSHIRKKSPTEIPSNIISIVISRLDKNSLLLEYAENYWTDQYFDQKLISSQI